MMSNYFDYLKKINVRQKISGFTLIELLVTISIFVFMTALVMSRYNDFYSGTIFKNLAYDIAITIREAQSYGISVKYNENNGADSPFDRAYGAYFPQGTGGVDFKLSSYSKSDGYVVRVDEKSYKLKHGATFEGLKVSLDGTSFTSASNLAVIFQRPNPEAIICATVNGAYGCSIYKYVEIILKASNGSLKTVKVNTSGQIAIKDE